MVDDRLRIDKWLWFARLAKTRTIAQKLAISGRVRINRQKNDSAASPVRPGDVLTIALDSGVRVLRIVALGTRRGPSPEAKLLYEEVAPALSHGADAIRPARSGRPTKRDRRALDRMQRRSPADEDFPSGET